MAQFLLAHQLLEGDAKDMQKQVAQKLAIGAVQVVDNPAQVVAHPATRAASLHAEAV